jgi:hypothetical protein
MTKYLQNNNRTRKIITSLHESQVLIIGTVSVVEVSDDR